MNKLTPAIKYFTRTTLWTRYFCIALFFSATSAHAGYSTNYESSSRTLLNTTIIGSLAVLGFACYQHKTPCGPGLDMNWSDNTLSVDSGGDKTIKVTRIAYGADWGEPLYRKGNFTLQGRFELNYVFWHSTKKNPSNAQGHIFGLLPVNQFVYTGWVIQPFLEIGAGPMLFDNAMVEDEFKSTLLQFGDLLGIGLQNDSFEMSFRFLHYSNANIRLPNPGLDTFNWHVGYKF